MPLSNATADPTRQSLTSRTGMESAQQLQQNAVPAQLHCPSGLSHSMGERDLAIYAGSDTVSKAGRAVKKTRNDTNKRHVVKNARFKKRVAPANRNKHRPARPYTTTRHPAHAKENSWVGTER